MTAALAIVPAQQPLEALIDAVVATMRSPHSRRAYGAALRRFLTWAGERCLPFSRDAIRAYIAYLQDSSASPATINLALAAIRAMAKESMDSGAIPQSTATAILAVRGVPRQAKRAGRWLTKEEARRLCDAPDSARDRALLALLVGCGLRRSEVCGLRWQQVQQLGGRTVLLGIVRKGSKVHTVVLSDWVVKRLEDWRHMPAGGNASIQPGTSTQCIENTEMQLREVAVEPAGDANHFAGKIFDLSPSGIFYIVERWSKAAGVKVAPHDLRRSAALLSLKGGADIRSVQTMLGHSSVQTTELYLQQALDMDNPACDRINI